ncbi:hypothetical protein [Variovorax sp. OV329]|uniref:hypothetical protein n=1 Tax=Variovorax sp. OV329 TaxID=1882825 RepID=UPI0008E935F5|nr:hypothetical protein [Variovorax sp. OV329]SFL87368.1 hypothetical protein SAMN05444747_10171 [Variovorax sp. OV329]
MNLDEASAATTLEPLAPPEWTMDVHQESGQFTAELKRNLVLVCRLSLMRADGDEATARAFLADKARRWIHDYLRRSPNP